MGQIKKALNKKYDLPFNLSESTLSMILGGVVVVLVGLIAFNFFRTQKDSATNPPAVVVKKDITVNRGTVNIEGVNIAASSSPSVSPSQTPILTTTPTATPKPTTTPTSKPSSTPTPKPTATPSVKPTVTKTPSMVPQDQRGQVVGEGKIAVALPTTHTVSNGETLWSIAEKYYGSGFNDLDIIQKNNIKNPSIIEPGQKITIPKVEPKTPTVAQVNRITVTDNKITADKYTVVAGDDLWAIAVRSYGDGYKYVEIAKVNKLQNPNLIHVGNTLIIPRN